MLRLRAFIFTLIKSNNTEALKFLVKHFNYRDSLNSKNQTPVHYCLTQHFSPYISSFDEFFNKDKYTNSILIPLLEANIKIDTSIYHGWSSYYLASDFKHPRVQELLYATDIDYPKYESANTGKDLDKLNEDEKKAMVIINARAEN